VNGAALKVAGARSFAAARWTIPYSYTASPATNVKGVVMTAVGRIQARILNSSATPMGRDCTFTVRCPPQRRLAATSRDFSFANDRSHRPRLSASGRYRGFNVR
jgi:hypothetical protein